MTTDFSSLAQLHSYSLASYWDARYVLSDAHTVFDWLQPAQAFFDILSPSLESNDEILVVGCGNSDLIRLLYQNNYCLLTAIDFSEVLIHQQVKRYEQYPEIEFTMMNMCHMTYPNGNFNKIIDKGSMDCLLTNMSTAPFEQALGEVYRCLKDGGCFFSLSHACERVRLSHFEVYNWDIRVFPIKRVTSRAVEHVTATPLPSTDYHYLYVCVK
ncbi:hypothetical protein PCE1_005020 [Barthelona sp. PCE]